MPVTKKDIVLIKITDEMDKMASYVANRRQLFEYPRSGYGDYQTRGVANIKAGILGELALLEYIYDYLNNKYQNIDIFERYEKLKNLKFAYQMIIGQADGGFEFMLGKNSVDVKTYATNKVSIEQIFHGLRQNGSPLNMLIDKTQNSTADIYVQTFITDTNHICLAGFCRGVPPINYSFPNPAHACVVTSLIPIDKIVDSLNES